MNDRVLERIVSSNKPSNVIKILKKEMVKIKATKVNLSKDH